MSVTGKKLLEQHKGTIINLVVSQALLALSLQAPWLRIKPINYIVTKILSFGVGWLLDKTIIGVNFILIDWEKDSNLKALNEAIGEIDLLPPDATPEQKEVIDAKITEAARNLIRLNDSSRM
jgi:hypothetical protein